MIDFVTTSDRRVRRARLARLARKAAEQKHADLLTVARNWTLEMIRAEHPQWVQPDGESPQSVQYYLNL